MTKMIKSELSPWATLAAADDNSEATIVIEGVIGWEDWWSESKKTTTKQQMRAELKKIANIKAKKIIVEINSYGGDVNHGVSMHDLLAEHSAQVITRVTGHTASAATIIAQAGDDRQMSDNALYLVHQAWTWAGGPIAELAETIEDLEKVNSTLARIYAKRSGRSIDEIREVMDRRQGAGEWLTALEAQELGLVDTIYEPTSMAASYDAAKFRACGTPEIPAEKLTCSKNDNNKGGVNMPNFLTKLLGMSEEQIEKQVSEHATAEARAELETARNERDTAQAALDTATAELETVKAELATAMAANEQAAAAAAALAATAAENKDEADEAERKLASLTAGNKAPASATAKLGFAAFREAVKAHMDEHGSSYEAASLAIQKENAELFQSMIDEANGR